MILVCRDEISTPPAWIDFSLRLHEETKFLPSKAGQLSTWHLSRFLCIFFEFCFVSMLVYKVENL